MEGALVAFKSGWVTFVQPIAIPQILTGQLTAGFEFLTKLGVEYPPAKLPGLKSLGQLTPISRSERRGLGRHAAVGKLYQCIAPHYPLQIVPEAGLQILAGGLAFSGIDFRIYAHSFGFILYFRFFFETAAGAPGLTGSDLARRLNNIERNRGLKIITKSLRRSGLVVRDLFADVYDKIVAAIFATLPPAPYLGPPFCIFSPESGEFAKNAEDLPDGQEDRVAVFSAIQRFTGKQDPKQVLGNKCFATNLGEEEDGAKGWALGAENGIALFIRPGETKLQATKARFCNHKNVARFIGWYQLYQQYLTKHAESYLPLDKDALQSALNARDTIAVRYSKWWPRWAMQRLGHEGPIAEVVKAYDLKRPYDPNKRVDPIEAKTTFDVDPVVNFKSFPSSLCIAKPNGTEALVTFRLRNNTHNAIKVQLSCELEQYSLVDENPCRVQPDDSTVYESRVTLKAKDAASLIVGENTQVKMQWRIVEPADGPPQSLTKQIAVLQKNYFPCARQPKGAKKWNNFSWLIAAWIDRTSKSLSGLYAEAAALNQKKLPGYPKIYGPGADEVVIPQVRALYQALRERKLSYGNDTILGFLSDDAQHFGQTVRFPEDSVNGGVINCLDGCVLFASLLTRCDLHPAILFVPGHALVGWKRFLDPTPEWVYLDATCLVDSDFDKALATGQERTAHLDEDQIIEVHDSNPQELDDINTAVLRVDIRGVLASGVQPLR